MNPRKLVELLRKYGYEGGYDRKSVEAFIASDECPDIDFGMDSKAALDRIFSTKGITLTVTRNDDEADTVNVVDGETEETEEADEETTEDEEEMKSLRRQISELEAKVGKKAAGLNEDKSATSRWGAKIVVESDAKAAYRRALKTPNKLNPYTGKKCVFEDVEQAEAAGRWFRYQAMGLYGKGYDAMSEDKAFLRSVGTKGAVLYDTNLGGAFSPPVEFRAELIDLQLEYGAARKLVPFQPIPKEGTIVPRWDTDLTMSWATEGDSESDQDPDTSNVALYPKRLSGLMKISYDLLLADAVGMVDQAFRSFARAAANKEDAAFFLGDGTSTYSGIVGLANAVGSAGVVTGASTWSAMTDAQVQQFMGTVAHYAWTNGPMKFTMTSNAFFQILNRLNFAKGGITYSESANSAPIFSYNGMEFIWNNSMASTSATSTPAAYFGAFAAGCKAGQSGSLEFRQSDQRYFEEYKLAVRVDEHVDINCHDIGDSSNAGPITQLATGS